MLVIDWLTLINAIGNLMQLLFSSITKSKQRQFCRVSVCLVVILEEASALHHVKDAHNTVNKYIELIAMNMMFPYYLPGNNRPGLLNLLWYVLISKVVSRTVLCRMFDCFIEH